MDNKTNVNKTILTHIGENVPEITVENDSPRFVFVNKDEDSKQRTISPSDLGLVGMHLSYTMKSGVSHSVKVSEFDGDDFYLFWRKEKRETSFLGIIGYPNNYNEIEEGLRNLMFSQGKNVNPDVNLDKVIEKLIDLLKIDLKKGIGISFCTIL